MKKLYLFLLAIVCSVGMWATVAPVGTVLWGETFESTTDAGADVALSSYDYSGRTCYGANVTYSVDDADNVRWSNSTASGISGCNLWLKKQQQKAFSTSAIDLGGATRVSFEFTRSKGAMIVSWKDASGSTWNVIYNKPTPTSAVTTASPIEFDIPNGVTSINIKIQEGNNSNNLRVDNLALKVVTAGSDAGGDGDDDDCESSITISKGEETNGTFTLSQTGDVCIDEGNASVDLTATPAEHYHLSEVQATVGTVGAISNNNCTISDIDANTTITAVFAEDPKHNARFSVNGVIDNNNNKVVYEGEAITFPADPADLYGKKFQGWTKTPDYSNAITAPGDLCKAANMGNTDVTYYAVFATQTEGAATLTKLGSSASFSAGDNIAIFAEVDGSHYGLYQETVSNSYVAYTVLDHTPTVADIDNNKKYITLEAATDGKWYLGDATNGYLYSSGSNNLNVSTTNGEKSAFTIAWNSTESKFSIKFGSRWVSCRSDLTDNSGANQYKYRLGGTGSSPLGDGYFDIYLYVAGNIDRSDYSTTVVATSDDITISSVGYATFFDADHKVLLPVGVTAYVAYNDNGTYRFGEAYSAGDVIPAGEPVVLAGSGNVSLQYTDAEAEDSYKEAGMNDLVGVASDITAAEMATAYSNDDYYHYAMSLDANHENVGFYWIADDGAAFAITAGKAFLVLPKSMFAGAAPTRFLFEDEEQTATAIETIEANDEVVKIIENGQLIIIMNGVRYNALGQAIR